jgi:hypothetical protein
LVAGNSIVCSGGVFTTLFYKIGEKTKSEKWLKEASPVDLTTATNAGMPRSGATFSAFSQIPVRVMLRTWQMM